MSRVTIGKTVGALLLVLVGVGLVFGGFEAAAYEKTIADREVTTQGAVVDSEVWQRPDGNWTYRFEFEYEFDQVEEITAQGLEDVYPYEMAGERTYRSSVRGGNDYDSRSEARSSMEDDWDGDPNDLTVYVDPFYPGDGSLSDATTLLPRALQYGGTVVLFLGLGGLARMARRVSA